MKMSDSIKNLAAALTLAQAEMPAAELNAVNPFLKNKFADLGSIISTAKPVLAKHGLSVSQLPVAINGDIGITTILMHSSGEWLESTVTLPVADEKGKSLAQVAGSIITYLRRYSLAAVLGMYADEDGDGATSPAHKAKPSTSRGATPSTKPQPVRTSGITPTTATELYDMASDQLGLNSKDAARILAAWLQEHHGTSNIGAYIKTDGPGALATLWQVLTESI
jgi:hypothetical protein